MKRELSPKKRIFLDAFRTSGNVRASALAARIGRRTHYAWLQNDMLYACAFEECREEAVGTLEAEARKRATEGGSDQLLMFLLKSLRPEVYRERYQDGPLTDDELIRRGKEAIDRIEAARRRLELLGDDPEDDAHEA